MRARSFTRITEYVAKTPWAINETGLRLILDIVAYRSLEHTIPAAEREQAEEQIAAAVDAARARRQTAPTPPGSIAVIPIDGPIVPKADSFSAISGATSMETLATEVQAAADDPNVAAIVLNIDSPGGSVDLVPETAAVIATAAKRKTVVAVANTMADSAAYWLASQASEIVASPSAEVGSIGVIAAHEDISALQEKAGVKTTLITFGKYKGELSPFQPLSDEARRAVQDRVDQTGNRFVADVARGRGTTVQQVSETYGQGRSVSAQDALARGMVDRVETLDQTLARLAVANAAHTQRANATGTQWNRNAELSKLPNPAGADALRAMHAWVDDTADPDLKGSYKFPHHRVDDADGEPGNGDETVGPANVNAVRDALGRVDQAGIPDGDREGVRAHLQRHLDDFDAQRMQPSAAAGPDTRTSPTSRATAASNSRKESSTVHTIDQLVARQEEIEARQKELDAANTGRLMEGDDRAEFDALENEYAENKAIIEDDRERKSRIAAKAGPESTLTGFSGRVERKSINVIGSTTRRAPDNIFDLERYRAAASSMDDLAEMYRDGAKRALESASFPHPRAKREEAQTHIDRLIADDSEDGRVARLIIATGSPMYERAFAKAICGRPLTSAEQHALSMAALSTSGSDGGFAVPYTLDPTVVPTSNGAVNPYRAICAVKTVATSPWKGVSSDGVTVSFDGEATEVNETSPVLAQPTIYPEKAQVFVRFSLEIEKNWAGMRAELARMIQDAKDQKEAEKFTSGAGHGSAEPQGLFAGLAGGSVVETDGASLATTDIDKLDGELPPRFEPNAVWIANKAFYGALRHLTGDQFDIFMPLADGIQKRQNGNTGRLLAGYEAYRCSEVTSDLTTTASKFAILGDPQYFAIVDQVGMTLEIVPHLFGETGLPTGERGLYGYFFTSSGILSDNAFRILSIGT